MRTQAILVVGLRRIIVMLIDGVCVAFQLYLSFVFSSFRSEIFLIGSGRNVTIVVVCA